MKKPTAEWVRKAEADFQLAARNYLPSERFYDQRCFFCQQSAEKYLKALLQELGQPIPRTHNLEDISALLVPFHAKIRSLNRGLKFLTRFAVGARYPGFDATKRQTTSALRWATRVRDECRRILKIRDRKPRKSP